MQIKGQEREKFKKINSGSEDAWDARTYELFVHKTEWDHDFSATEVAKISKPRNSLTQNMDDSKLKQYIWLSLIPCNLMKDSKSLGTNPLYGIL